MAVRADGLLFPFGLYRSSTRYLAEVSVVGRGLVVVGRVRTGSTVHTDTVPMFS